MADLHIHDPTIDDAQGDYLVRAIDSLRLEAAGGEPPALSRRVLPVCGKRCVRSGVSSRAQPMSSASHR
jgi:hypothetical protein